MTLADALSGLRRLKPARRVVVVKPTTGELPLDLIAAIDGCTVVERSGGDDGDRRVIVQLEGRNAGWIHSDENDRAALLVRWPELNDEQLKRATRYLDATVRNHLRGAIQQRPRSNWVTSWREDF